MLKHRSVSDFLGIESDEPGIIYSKDEFPAAELFDRFPVDAVVDFSSEEGIDYYAEAAANKGAIIISAVSQYQEAAKIKLKELALKTTVMHSPNITLGVNFVIIASKVLKNIAPYTDIEIVEEHFKQKQETSGTARIIANELGINNDNIKSIRAGGIIGVHEILFGFPYQTVRLRHESISREAFGNGILFCIQNLKDKPRGLYTMEDLLLPYFKLDQHIIDKSYKKH